MRISRMASVYFTAAYSAAPRRNSGFAVIAGVATLLIGAVAVAADEPNTASDSTAVSNAPAPEVAEVPLFPETARTGDTSKKPEATDTHGTTGTQESTGAQASSSPDATGQGEAGAKAPNSSATGQIESEVIVEGKPVCKSVVVTGTRLRKQVCTTNPVAQQGNDKYQEQMAKDYLRRMSEQGSRAQENPSAFSTSGIPGL